MKAFMFSILFMLSIGANFYVLFRLWHIIPLPALKWTVVSLGMVAFASFFIVMRAGEALPVWLTGTLYKLGTSWLFIMLYLLLIFLLIDIVRLTHLLPLKQYVLRSWMGFGVIAGVVMVTMVTGYVIYRNKARVEITLETTKLAPGDRGFRIVAISDLHLGYGIGERELEKWVELINEENPDAVVIAGDLVDNSLRPLEEGRFKEILRGIRSRYGTFIAPGNHDYFTGIDNTSRFIDEAGMIFLRDSAAMVGDRFYIVGRDDRSRRRRQPLDELVAPLDKGKPIIMLDHQPYNLREAERNGIDFQFSGHTHHGQIWPISWITNGMYEKSHGFMQKGASGYFVSSGIGIWGGKFRIGTRSEYIVINIVPANGTLPEI